ncbi:MAG TPA: hypothetical protein VFR58_07120 [Flavisolibacter sp.]|nr:hypothetical protein [Flavisolibacter sp.]
MNIPNMKSAKMITKILRHPGVVLLTFSEFSASFIYKELTAQGRSLSAYVLGCLFKTPGPSLYALVPGSKGKEVSFRAINC